MEGCSYYLAMVLVQLIYGGSNILIKFSLAEVLNPIVFVACYGHGFAAKNFVLALFGTTIHLNVYYAGLAYTSPTVACGLSNVIPSLTFLMAVLLGLEKLKIRTARGQAKVAGTLFGIGGSLVFTFWKGGYLFKVYTAQLSLTTMICFYALLQSSFLALFFTRNPISWRLERNLQLLTIVYCSTSIIIVALFSAISFAERLHFGSLIGAFLIIVGLYCVMWGKKERQSCC
ncbi:hypothetical protein PRUPE_4G100100 [Prunus persica]|uniref:WAT1-related protein n=1 Tax=Prunus persica TaxID=3760 RepID=A0A251PJR1_PRUPE|nr:hypothetical protein PRUPE_4G100100 [Prunus persica]